MRTNKHQHDKLVNNPDTTKIKMKTNDIFRVKSTNTQRREKAKDHFILQSNGAFTY